MGIAQATQKYGRRVLLAGAVVMGTAVLALLVVAEPGVTPWQLAPRARLRRPRQRADHGPLLHHRDGRGRSPGDRLGLRRPHRDPAGRQTRSAWPSSAPSTSAPAAWRSLSRWPPRWSRRPSWSG
ncbi:hypothetical protein [Nonomuraea dietziae]|uniref:hypothetical protein n=1 Tax=Nonomuraea dietziae TaxID=65515 RepID=UPI0031D82152